MEKRNNGHDMVGYDAAQFVRNTVLDPKSWPLFDVILNKLLLAGLEQEPILFKFGWGEMPK